MDSEDLHGLLKSSLDAHKAGDSAAALKEAGEEFLSVAQLRAIKLGGDHPDTVAAMKNAAWARNLETSRFSKALARGAHETLNVAFGGPPTATNIGAATVSAIAEHVARKSETT